MTSRRLNVKKQQKRYSAFLTTHYITYKAAHKASHYQMIKQSY